MIGNSAQLNGVWAVGGPDVEKIAAEGFDVTGPVPARRRRSKPKGPLGDSVSGAIRKIRI